MADHIVTPPPPQLPPLPEGPVGLVPAHALVAGVMRYLVASDEAMFKELIIKGDPIPGESVALTSYMRNVLRTYDNAVLAAQSASIPKIATLAMECLNTGDVAGAKTALASVILLADFVEQPQPS